MLQFTSDLQKDNLPVKIQYRKQAVSDSLIKRIAIPKDLTGQYIYFSLVAVNNDSTNCIYGDWMCNPNYTDIDSIKITLETGLSSQWLKVIEPEKIIEPVIQTSIELQHYVIYNYRYRIRGKKLVYIAD